MLVHVHTIFSTHLCRLIRHGGFAAQSLFNLRQKRYYCNHIFYTTKSAISLRVGKIPVLALLGRRMLSFPGCMLFLVNDTKRPSHG